MKHRNIHLSKALTIALAVVSAGQLLACSSSGSKEIDGALQAQKQQFPPGWPGNRGEEGSSNQSGDSPVSDSGGSDNPGGVTPGGSAGASPPGTGAADYPGQPGVSEPGYAGGGEPGYGGAPGASAPGSKPNYPGQGDGREPGVSSGSSGGDVVVGKDVVSEDGLTVSHTVTGPQKEWTTEEMLLARPMGMSGEEREFDSSHRAPETIREWTLGQFQEYIKSPLGKQSMLGEGQRWISLRRMLKGQVLNSREFLAGKKLTVPKRRLNPNEAPVADPEFLKDTGAFAPEKSSETFESLKACRQEIADLCKELDGLKTTARKRGKLESMENAISSVEWE